MQSGHNVKVILIKYQEIRNNKKNKLVSNIRFMYMSVAYVSIKDYYTDY